MGQKMLLPPAYEKFFAALSPSTVIDAKATETMEIPLNSFQSAVSSVFNSLAISLV